jgi:hypothetical protein
VIGDIVTEESDIAVLKARLASVEGRFDRLEETLSKILERVTLARGGLAMLIAIGSVCATLAGAVVLWLHGGKAP